MTVLMTFEQLCVRVEEERKNPPLCPKCGHKLDLSGVTQSELPPGWDCDNCYYSELGALVEEHPIVSVRR